MSYGELKGFKSVFGFGGMAPGLCTSLCATPNNTTRKVSLIWSDPIDTMIDGLLLSSWKKTTIVRKEGSYPTSVTDGSKILVNTTRNAHANTPYVDDNFESTDDVTNFFYMAFPESDTGSMSVNEGNHFSDKIIYGFKIASSNTDPDGRVTYLEDAVGMSPASMNFSTGAFNYGSWENAFFMPRPCMLKYDGTVDYYLDPNDYSKKADGTASDYNSSTYGGNVMIEFPTIWLYHTTDGTYDYTYISNTKVNSSYEAYAHHDRNGAIMPYTYVRAYEGSLISSKIRSLSGQSVMNSQTGTNEITYATANGSLIWNTGLLVDRIMINDLLTLIGKSTDTQSVFGNGHYTGGSSASNLLVTGTMNTKGLFWGTNGTGSGVKVFGIENWWGNAWERIAGLINASGTQKIKLTYGTEDGSTTSGYNTSGSGYITLTGATPGGTTGGYISACMATQYGRFPMTASGSQTTYECDGLWFNNSQTNYAIVGGACSDGFLVGAFAVYLSYLVSGAYWSFSASLSCKPTVTA